MYARVTQFEIDTVAISMPRAVERFEQLIMPEVRRQPGYRGVLVLDNDEGRGLLVSFWDSEGAAEAGLASGFYDEQVKKFLTLYRQAPGREHFKVDVVEGIELAAGTV